jgi:methoxymalonate biosynthesis acyl carrier protein
VNSGVTEQVQQILLRELNVDVPSEQADLIESGLIDSLALVELLVAIEREFGVSFELEELEPDNFRSVSRIAELISTVGGRAGR